MVPGRACPSPPLRVGRVPRLQSFAPTVSAACAPLVRNTWACSCWWRRSTRTCVHAPPLLLGTCALHCWRRVRAWDRQFHAAEAPPARRRAQRAKGRAMVILARAGGFSCFRRRGGSSRPQRGLTSYSPPDAKEWATTRAFEPLVADSLHACRYYVRRPSQRAAIICSTAPAMRAYLGAWRGPRCMRARVGEQARRGAAAQLAASYHHVCSMSTRLLCRVMWPQVRRGNALSVRLALWPARRVPLSWRPL